MKRDELRRVYVKLKKNSDYVLGYFHHWGIEIGSHDRTMGQFGHITVAIIELEDGCIITELPTNLIFETEQNINIPPKYSHGY